MNFEKRPKIAGIINRVKESNNKEETVQFENKLLCLFASPLLLTGAVLNYLLRSYFLKEGQTIILLDTVVFIFLALLFEFFSRAKVDPKRQNLMVSVLYSISLLFVILRLYSYIGPAIWTIVFILITLSLMRVDSNMLRITAAMTLLILIVLITKLLETTYQITVAYYIIQTILLLLLLQSAILTHHTMIFRNKKAIQLYLEAVEQKEQIQSLYEKVLSSQQELDINEKKLSEYDIKIKESEEKLNQLSYVNSLTALPNRKSFTEYLNIQIDMAEKANSDIYLVMINLDHFKIINDVQGHNIGDMILKMVSACLKKHVQEEDFLGHIGGDEFAIIINRSINKEELSSYLSMIRDSIQAPYQIENNKLSLTASFGIAHYPENCASAEDMFKFADTAMNKAKGLGEKKIQFFDQSMKNVLLKKYEMENMLQQAIRKQEFHLEYQAQYNMNTGKLRGFEALLRWNQPKIGSISPLEFIPIAEETGYIHQIGEWVLKSACHKFAEMKNEYYINSIISINISAAQVSKEGFSELVGKILFETGLPPEALELEISESIFLRISVEAIENMKELKKLGVRISLDDFGTGYSSLNYLLQIPIDSLKIDRTFISTILDVESEKSIICDIISMAHRLKIAVIAEGVEEQHQKDYLYNHECDFIQGYLTGMPSRELDLKKVI